MEKLLLAVIVLLFSSSVSAGNAWYYGKVTSLQTFTEDGSFLVYLDNSEISANCNSSRVRFTVSNMGAERTKSALSMALTAFTTGKEFGVVVDLDVSVDSVCYVSNTASQGAGIK